MTSGAPILTPPTDPGPKRWTVSEFMQLAEAGLLSSRAELVHGEIWEMAPQGNLHAIVVARLYDKLRAIFPQPWFIRIESTHRFREDLAYEPDLCVLDREPSLVSEVDELPRLIVEVSDSTLTYDLTQKRFDYAQQGIAEYWIVDAKRRQIHVFRKPTHHARNADEAYAQELVVRETDTIAPLAAPGQAIVVRDLFPA